MKWLEKSALALMTGVMPVFIAACYGVQLEGLNAWGTVKDKVSKNPIGNILVRCLISGQIQDETYTAAGDGSYELFLERDNPCDELQFEDIDGEENGGLYVTQVIPFSREASVELELEDTTEE